jgi:hypothetical protein
LQRTIPGERKKIGAMCTLLTSSSWADSSGYGDGGKHILVGSFISTPAAIGAPDALNDFGDNRFPPDTLHRALSNHNL